LLCIVLLFVPSLIAHKKPHNEEKEHEDHDKKGSMPLCSYKSTTGEEYDLRLLENNAVVDYQYFDATSKSTFYFRPCGSVKTSGCESGSSVCMINSAGKAVNFGTGPAQWADGAENGASIEATYGKGELCNNGVPRKTIVEYVCNLNAVSSSIVRGTFDECSAEFVIESPYACSVSNYCQSIDNSASCDAQDGLCKWANNKCEHKLACPGWKHLSHSGLFVIIILASTGGLLACTLCLCVCACRRRRRCRSARACRRFNKKTARKNTKVEKKQVKKVTEVEYAPFQMPFQLVPGGFAPINPYSNIQGYPLVTFVAPQTEPEQV